MSLSIEPFYEPESSTWTYLVADTEQGEAAIIDPVWVYDAASGGVGREFIDRVLSAANERGWTVRWVLETHAHADHLSAGALIREETGAKIAIGEGIRSVQATFSRVFNTDDAERPVDGSQFDRLLREGDEITLGGQVIRVLDTPGHTNDSITYLVGDAAFIGDTLFAPSFGSARCDFPGGDAALLYDSVQKLYALPGATRLYLCHDYPAEGAEPRCMVTVDESRRDNVHLKADTTREAFVALREQRDAGLGLPKLIFPSIQVNVLAGAAPPPEDNGASYIKVPFNTTIPRLLR
jgi:glyoxylase-like metal-dependent hydrolase (beta-lactamase superfamily II)